MNIQKANKVMDAIFTLAEFFGEKPELVIGNLCFLDKEKKAKIIEANNLRNSFIDMSVAERGRALGYGVVENKNGNIEISTVLEPNSN